MVTFDKKKSKRRLEGHNKEVREYFKDRPNDLLVMNICAGDGWEKLCPFLDKNIPAGPFPYMHKKPSLIKYFIKIKLKKYK